VQTQGNRLPDGGFVTTYTDVSENETSTKRISKQPTKTLEEKVEQRTEILSRLNKKLQETTESKTRFLAGGKP
jgi:hypothetical protein